MHLSGVGGYRGIEGSRTFSIMGDQSHSLRQIEFGLQRKLVEAGFANELKNIALSLDSLSNPSIGMKGDVMEMISSIEEESLRNELAENVLIILSNQQFLNRGSVDIAKSLFDFDMVSEESKQTFITYTRGKIRSAYEALDRFDQDSAQVNKPQDSKYISSSELKSRFEEAGLGDFYLDVYRVVNNIHNPELPHELNIMYGGRNFNEIDDPNLKQELAENLLSTLSQDKSFSYPSINFVNRFLKPIVSSESLGKYLTGIRSKLDDISSLINNKQIPQQRDIPNILKLHSPQ